MRNKLPNEKYKGYLPDSLLEKSDKAAYFIEKNYKDKVGGLWMFTDFEDADAETDFVIETSIGKGEEYTRLDARLSLACGGSTLWNIDEGYYEDGVASGIKEMLEARLYKAYICGTIVRLI